MKILHIDPDDIDNPYSGGGPVRNYEIYKRLSKRHEITVLTPTFDGSTSEKVRDGIRYVRLGKKIGDHGSSHHITFFFSLPKAVRSMEYDLLVEDFMPPLSSTINPLFAKAPVIGSVQWFFAESLSKQYKLPFFLGERYGVRLYRNLIVLTDQMRGLIQERNPNANLKVIPNGVEDALFNAEGKFGDYILYLGRVDVQQKGVDLLLCSYAKIPESKRLPLCLVGHCFQEREVMSLINSLGLHQWVTVRPRVSGLDKIKLISQSRFVCVPSREETFGMVITEACACGKAVVLFDKAPMNEVASKACIKVEPFDMDAYSKAMLDLLNRTEQEMSSISQVCVDWASKFQWDEIALQQEQFYISVVQGN